MNEIERPTPNSARTVRAYPVTPDRLLAAFRKAVEDLPHWEIVSSEQSGLKAVRTTRLIRFRDDVNVRVYDGADGAAAEVTSASRIGRGDLGQNPRNIKELLQAVARETDLPGQHPQN